MIPNVYVLYGCYITTNYWWFFLSLELTGETIPLFQLMQIHKLYIVES